MNKYRIAHEVYQEYLREVHGAFESPSERLAMGLWLSKKINAEENGLDLTKIKKGDTITIGGVEFMCEGINDEKCIVYTYKFK